jgi:hypothetical protein
VGVNNNWRKIPDLDGTRDGGPRRELNRNGVLGRLQRGRDEPRTGLAWLRALGVQPGFILGLWLLLAGDKE